MSKKKKSDLIEREVLKKNEVSANVWASYILLFISAVNLLGWMLSGTLLNETDGPIMAVAYFANITVSLLSGLFTLSNAGKSSKDKYLVCFSLSMVCLLLQIVTIYGYSLLVLLPVLMSICYCNESFTLRVGIHSFAYYLIYMVLSDYIGVRAGYYRLADGALDSGTGVIIHYVLDKSFSVVGEPTLKTLLVAQIPDMLLNGVCIVVCVFICCKLAKRGLRTLQDTADLYERKQQVEDEVKDAKSKIMISQLQPHFLYNSLSAIMAIDDNPPQTVTALAEFSRYLRGNLNALTCSELIPFSGELEHVRHYVSLEKLRFGDKLSVDYNIETEDFLIPPLTVQMTVENAIKHGISSIEKGGSVLVSVKKQTDAICITVSDDGCGFDVEKYRGQDTPGHVGLNSAKQRVESLTGGTYTIESTIGVGTVVTVKIPKKEM